MNYVVTIEKDGHRFQLVMTAQSKPEAIRATLEAFRKNPSPTNFLISIEESS